MTSSDTDDSAAFSDLTEEDTDGSGRSDSEDQASLLDQLVAVQSRFQVSENATRNDRLWAMAKLLPFATIVLLVLAGGTIIVALSLRAYLFTLGTNYFGVDSVISYAGFAIILAALIYVLYGEMGGIPTPYRRFVGGIIGIVIGALPIVVMGLGLNNPLGSITALGSALVLLALGGVLLWWSSCPYQIM